MAVGAGLLGFGPAQAATVNATYTPAADATVRIHLPPSKTVAAEPLLEVRSSVKEGTSEAYVRFDLSDTVSSLDSARLRVYAKMAEPGTAKLMVRSVPNSDWRDDSLSWGNKPDQGTALGSVEVTGISAAWYDVDVSSFVRAEQAAGRLQMSFALIMAGASDNKILVHSREARDHQPELAGPRAPFTTKISFLPATSTPPEGYLADNGKPFGPRGNGLRFGWDVDNTEMMRDRAAPKPNQGKPMKGPDRRHEVCAYMEHNKRPKSAKWEIALPNGFYRVHLMAGDVQSYDSVYAIDVEKTTVVDGIPDKSKRWVEGIQTIRVQDGRLTVSSNPNGSKNKINFIEITEVTQ